MDSWWNFFYLCGSAAATLTGLTFVAVTLGSALIRKDTLTEVNVFLSPLCFHFLHVFFLCCMTAVPGAHPGLTGVAAIVSALWRLTKLPKTYSVLRAQAKIEETDVDIDLSDWVLLVVLPTTIYLSLIAAGIAFLSGNSWAAPVLAASCLALLLGTAISAWDTLVTIAVLIPSGQNGPAQEEKPKNA
jgi:hypothetical protein